jgi:hypothetical protein
MDMTFVNLRFDFERENRPLSAQREGMTRDKKREPLKATL